MRTTATITPTTHNSAGGLLVSLDGRPLPLQAVELRCRAAAGLARSLLRQRFVNPYDETLHVRYLLPLPADGAVSAFRFRIGERTIVGQVERRESARESFEEALLRGQSAALLEQERSSLFSQEIANIPAGETLVCELCIDQPLAWCEDGSWEYRFPTSVAPRYQGAPGRVADAEALRVPVAPEGLPLRLELDLEVEDELAAGAELESPTHALRTSGARREWRARLTDEEGAALDRDLVVRWRVAGADVESELRCGAGQAGLAARAFGLLSLLPPGLGVESRAQEALRRELVLLIDTSGSMSGRPLEQAKAVLGELIGSLAEGDELEMIEFSTQTRRWSDAPRRIDARTRSAARLWVRELRAGGGTEMTQAIRAALRPLDLRCQRQIVLVSDGYIGFEREVVAALACELPAGARVHTLGVGSAVNRSLTAPAARIGRGLELLVGLDEEPGDAARRLVAGTQAPLVVELELSGSALRAHAPLRLPDLFARRPAQLSLELAPEGGALELRGRTRSGSWSRRVVVPPIAGGAAAPELACRFARECVEDLECELAAGASGARIDALIEQLGLEFGIATRATSWIAVSDEPDVDAGAPARRESVPHALPYGTSIEGLGLRPLAGGSPLASPCIAAPRPAQAALPGRIRNALFGGGRSSGSGAGIRDQLPRASSAEEGEDVDSAPLEPQEWALAQAREQALPLLARIRSLSGHRLVLELESPGLDWHLPRRVRLRFADGSELEVGVQRLWSTHSGRVARAHWIRLVLACGSARCTERPIALTWDEPSGTREARIR